MELLDKLGPLCTSIGAVTAVTGLAATYYMSKMPDPTCIPPVDLDDQSYLLEDGSRCSKLVPKGKEYQPAYEGVETFHDVFLRGLNVSGNGPFLGTRSGPNLEYEWLTYQEVYDKFKAFGSWMINEGLKGSTDTIIGIFSQNRVEWIVAEKACAAYSMVPVALYDTLGEEAVIYIIKQTNMPLIVCDVAVKVNKLLSMVSNGDGRSLKYIVIMNGLEGVDTALADKCGVKVVPFQEALERGAKNLQPVQPPSADELALICYTSGTTET